MEERPTAAVILSIIGGILILIGSVLTLLMIMYGWIGHGMMGSFGEMMGSIGGIMSGYMDMLQNFGIPHNLISILWLVGLVCGVLIVVGALLLNAYPADHDTWGTVILVFSIVSFLSIAGFFVGAVLGIIGGVLALTWRQ